MKKLFYLILIAVGFTACDKSFEEPVQDDLVLKGAQKSETGCVSLKDGSLVYADGHYLEGQAIPVGFDMYGYNYQAHMFNGSYFNAYAGRPGTALPPYEGDDEAYLAENPEAESNSLWPYRNDVLIMKWNDAWLANSDCDSDGVLDRHYGFDSYIGSGAWLTNHISGVTVNEDGSECKWNYFTKIIAVPEDAQKVDGIWYTAEGTEIGPVIWGQFATIQEVSKDPCTGDHGLLYKSMDHTGFGGW
ncbi:hypothetical protein [Maribellus sediminis]|uniref:hypothetical protein n=1 Tax=Maribellus sediminis TaxID=2696285 RepID=UPI001432270C|nr:hypothetical protein [Maribellus sediminis]